jgi:hypothetical protein
MADKRCGRHLASRPDARRPADGDDIPEPSLPLAFSYFVPVPTGELGHVEADPGLLARELHRGYPQR